MGGEWRVFAGRGGRWGGVVEQLQQILGPAWILCELTDPWPLCGAFSLCIWETAAFKIVNAVSTTHLVACWGLGAIV